MTSSQATEQFLSWLDTIQSTGMWRYKPTSYAGIANILTELIGWSEALPAVLECQDCAFLSHLVAWMGPPPDTSSWAPLIERLESLDLSTLIFREVFDGLPRLLRHAPHAPTITRLLRFVREDYHDIDQPAHVELFFLLDADEATALMRELRPRLRPEHVRRFVATFGLEHLGVMTELLERHRRDRLTILIEALWPVHHPDLAPPMLRWSLDTTTRRAAERWLLGEGAHAIEGMLRVLTRSGASSRRAITHLRTLSSDHTELIRELAGAHSDATRGILERHVFGHDASLREVLADEDLTDWMRALAATPPSATAEELESAALSFDIVLRDGALLPREVALGALRACAHRHLDLLRPQGCLGDPSKLSTREAATLEAMSPEALAGASALESLHEHADLVISGPFAWEVFEWWASNRRSRSHAWCVWLIGYLGGEQQAVQLADAVRHTRGLSRDETKRMLNVLELMSTPYAWHEILLIAQRGPRADVRKIATSHVQGLLRTTGWTQEQLEDRVVPTCGLDARGTREFSYGPRSFMVRFSGPTMTSFVERPGGKVWSHLPPKRKTDDIRAVGVAKDSYKVFRRELDTVVEEQIRRLRGAMRKERTWPIADWREHVFEHPLMCHFAHALVWMQLDEDGEPMRFFLPTPDGSCVDQEHDTVELGDEPVAVAHIDLLTTAERQAWQDLLADFELVQPFSQLSDTV